MRHLRSKLFVLIYLVSVSACNSPAEEPQVLAAREYFTLEMPVEGPASRQLVQFIEAIRTGNRDTVRVLIENDMAGFLQEIPIEEHIDQLMDFHTGFSQLVFDRYVRNEPFATRGLFYNAHMDSWVNIGVDVESEPPHRIYMISLEPGHAPEQ